MLTQIVIKTNNNFDGHEIKMSKSDDQEKIE